VNRELLAVLLGLGSAATWGAGDFAGGLASRRGSVLAVLAVGQLAGVSLLAAVAIAAGEAAPPREGLLWSAAAGVAGAAGLAALYRGLAVGRMGIVAPVSAVLSAAIPVAAGALQEGLPPAAKLLGFALGLAGIWLVAGGGPAGDGARPAGLGLALLAGLGFGGYLVLMAKGAEGGAFWPLAASRGTSLALAVAAGAVALAAGRPPGPPARAALPLVLLSGVLDAAGNALFVLAARAGRLDVAAVLSSMYPATTVALAALVLRERVSARQRAGIAAVLGAIALIAS
jgi:drug/metabolite transporter (DMT)-like permease